MEERTDYFGDRGEAIRAARRDYEKVLRALEIDPKSDASAIGRAMAKIYSDGSMSHLRQRVCETLWRTGELLNTLITDIAGREAGWDLEANLARKARRDERHDAWILWFQRSVRWVASAVIAVALYSGAVNLAERYPTVVHVPVHDWFAPHREEK